MKIRAKYGIGACKECRGPIQAGQWVNWDKNTRDMVHVGCEKGSGEQPKLSQHSDHLVLGMPFTKAGE